MSERNSTTFPTRRDFRPLPLASVTFGAGEVIVTMSIGQWDALLSAAYEAGCILLELDDEESVRAYQKRSDVAERGK